MGSLSVVQIVVISTFCCYVSVQHTGKTNERNGVKDRVDQLVEVISVSALLSPKLNKYASSAKRQSARRWRAAVSGLGVSG